MAGRPKVKDVQPLIDPEGNIIGATTYEQPNQINIDAVWGPEDDVLTQELEVTLNDGLDEINKQEIVENIIHYASELHTILEGIYVGGHAAQIRDMLGVALEQYKKL